jgi:hypothetical protein
LTEAAAPGHEAGEMRHVVPISSLRRALCGAAALLLGCGGLAEDGRRAALPELEPQLEPEVNGESSTSPAAVPPEQELDEPALRRAQPAGGAPAGQACGLEPGAEGVVVGSVELRRDPLCGASSWCLMRAEPTGECSGSVQAGCQSGEFIAVAPPRAETAPWQEDTCTCRCGGELGDGFCACPQGMRCEPLIPSAGFDSAARPFIGSYCVY